jgi:cytochrome c peroxidase
MKKITQGGVNLSTKEKNDLKAFLLSLSDSEFTAHADFQE